MTPHAPGVAPTAVVASDAACPGAMIGPYAVVGLDGPADAPGLRLGAGAVIRSHAVLYRGTTAGARFHAGHGALVREHTSAGDDVSIGSHSTIEHHVVLGDRVRIHGGCFVPEFSVLADDAWLGPHVVVTNARYPNRPDTKERLEGVRIGARAVIGAGAVLLPGIEIGEGAVVGAGTVVVDDVPAGRTLVGPGGRLL